MTSASGSILSLALILAACGGGNDLGVDAPPGGDANEEGCLLAENLGVIGPAPGIAPGGLSWGNEFDPYLVEGKGPFNENGGLGNLPDWFVVRLFDQTAPFPTDLTPGTFQLEGPELNYETCGTCVLLVGNHTGDRNEEVTNAYMATSGTLQIDSVIPTLSVTLTNATFQHVFFTVPDRTHIPNESGCTTSVTELSFTADVSNLAGLTELQPGPEGGRMNEHLRR